MTTATLPSPAAPASTGSVDIDSRAAYTSFGLAYVLGHGASAVASGPDPLIALPSWLPTTLLGIGLATAPITYKMLISPEQGG
jgi:hypothetical protein